MPGTAQHVVDHASPLVHTVRRADGERLREIFLKYATKKHGKSGAPCMTPDDFVRRYLGLFADENFNRESVRLVASAANPTKDELITFEEFQAFESILRSPDALYLTAFEMFDRGATGTISFAEFKRVIAHTQPVLSCDFDFDCQFIKEYFGGDKSRLIDYLEFCELLHDFYEEQGLQAFRRCDSKQTGHISSPDFYKIMTTVKNHMLTSWVKQNLTPLLNETSKNNTVSFPYYTAFNSMLAKMDLLKRIYLNIARNNLKMEVTKDEFLHAAQPYAHVTPLEVQILFRLSEFNHPERKTLDFDDLEKIDPDHLKRVSYMRRLTNVKAVNSPAERGVFVQFLEIGYRFSLGAIGGACGATAVYPIDLVKTRMQNQRNVSIVGELMYKNSWDCFRKVLRHEGFAGLYRGLVPQLMGVAPEKAIKLTMNDLVRDKFTTHGKIPLWAEALAGACGGGSQVLFTNPVEIVKIRLQVAGEVRTPGGATHRVGVGSVLRELGFRGLYRGSRACFLRDIPFSAIYFPAYAHAKTWTADQDGHNSVGSLFCSAFVAGVPAAGLVTPADVVKTRLQVAARAGQTTYSGVTDCFRKVLREEGWTALWKGSAARVLRSSPQFGVTLMVYEVLQRAFYVDFGGIRPAGSEVPAHATLTDSLSTNRDHVGGYALAAATFAGIENKFGLFLPRFEPALALRAK